MTDAGLTGSERAVAPGRPIDSLPTPVLSLDLDYFERNCRRILGFLEDAGVAWRPHMKAHKSPWIARRQLELGACGVTCAKLSEAEVMAAAGIESILIANQLVDPEKLGRLSRLQRDAEVMVCVDNPVQIALAAEAAISAGFDIPVLVEVDVGEHRAGLPPGEATIELAKLAAASRGIKFRGLMGYEGHVITMWPEETRARACEQALRPLVETRLALEALGIPVEIVSSGSSGTYRTTACIRGITEVQAGGAVLMDAFYANDCHIDGMEFALKLHATVISRPTKDRAIMDAGWKAISNSVGGLPRVVNRPGLTVDRLDAEHGVIRSETAARDVEIGERLVMIPGYSDATIFLHNQIVGLRQNQVTDILPLSARGMLT